MSILACSVDGCDRALYVKKSRLCKRHYNRLHYSGSVELPDEPDSCLGCGGAIRASKARGAKPKYCSEDCRKAAGYRKFIESGKYALQLEAKRQVSAAKPLPVHVCVQCGAEWTKSRTASRFCSSKCMNKHADIHNSRRCNEPDCDRGVRAKGLCHMHWRRKARAEGRETLPAWDDRRRANYHKRRAQKVTTSVENLVPLDIYQRDIWLCGLCSTPVDPDVSWPDPYSASLDHVLPLSKGGSHTYENVQLAHLTCNVSKGNRISA